MVDNTILAQYRPLDIHVYICIVVLSVSEYIKVTALLIELLYTMYMYLYILCLKDLCGIDEPEGPYTVVTGGSTCV